MGCRISVMFKGNVSELLAIGRREATAYGGVLKGDEHRGSFSMNALGGTFTGNYLIEEYTIQIELVKKPIWIPCVAIENFLRANIS